MGGLSPFCRFGVRTAGLAFAIASVEPAQAFEETFDRSAVIEEAPSANQSRSAAWWLNSGGRVVFSGGVGRTLQGISPPSDLWRRAYAQSNPGDSDLGMRPQNLFRLLTQETARDHRQQVSLRILATNLPAGSGRDPFSGFFLDARRLNEENGYVAGLRFDGKAVIKKQRQGAFYTLAIAPVYSAATAPGTLLPQDRWLSLRLSIETVADGARLVLELHDPALSPQWTRVIEVIDGPGGTDGPPIEQSGRAGIRADFMDLELEDYFAFLPPDAVRDLPGGHDDRRAIATLRTVPTPDAPLDVFSFGDAGAGARPLVGRWIAGACAETIGLHVPSLGAFVLSTDNAGGPAEIEFGFGPPGVPMLPIAGDWDGDGVDGVGLYDPATGAFFLNDRLGPGVADHAFFFGAGGNRFSPISGDWNGDGVDGVGLYDAKTGVFFLTDRLGPGIADHVLPFGPAGQALLPIAGDWDGDGIDTVGVFRAADGLFAQRNSLSGGEADRVDVLAGTTPFTLPVAGAFEEACS